MESIRLNNKSLDPNNKIVVSTNDNPIINHLSPIYNTLITEVTALNLVIRNTDEKVLKRLEN